MRQKNINVIRFLGIAQDFKWDIFCKIAIVNFKPRAEIKKKL
jgi:hypothetical protein